MINSYPQTRAKLAVAPTSAESTSDFPCLPRFTERKKPNNFDVLIQPSSTVIFFFFTTDVEDLNVSEEAVNNQNCEDTRAHFVTKAMPMLCVTVHHPQPAPTVR